LETHWFKHLPSTHKYLIENIKNSTLMPPCAIGVDFQSAGVGSRGNSWEGDEGNLYFSFCVEEKHLPKDLLLESTSIYFSYILKEVLCELGSNIWIKWPNDFYIKDVKVGGVITTKVAGVIIGSIGMNILHAPEQFGTLDIQISPQKLVNYFLQKLDKNISWKNVFSKYKIEFQNSLGFTFHLDGKKLSLANAKLLDDGSIEVENKRVYSLR
jgi:BirA family biotin operon repressor/biotin-[acetyl-CoA-carboxylase] ligase